MFKSKNFQHTTLMVWPFKKKKRASHLTDLERELALQTRLENKSLRDMQRMLKMKELELKKMEIQSEIDEYLPNEEDNALGLGSEEMKLLELLQNTGILKGNPVTSNISPTHENNEQLTPNENASKLMEQIPAPFLKRLKEIPKSDLHSLVDNL